MPPEDATDFGLRTQESVLWRDIARADPAGIFGRNVDWLSSVRPGDRVPQPGYVGPTYRPGGVLFLSSNPGPEPRGPTTLQDLRQYEATARLAQADASSTRSRFDELTAVLAEIMPTWDIFQTFVAPLMTSRRFADVAYLNVLKWRTAREGRIDLPVLYNQSWTAHTRQQVFLLDPRFIVVIGKGVAEWLVNAYSGNAAIDFIPRRYSNLGIDGRDALIRVEARLREIGL
jgi:hypothetical protein